MSPKLLNLFLVLLPISLYYGYIDPVYTGAQGFVWTPESSIVVLSAQKAQYENVTNQINLIDSEIIKVNKEYLALDKDVKSKVEMMLPNSIDPFKLRNEVTSIANKTGVAISGLKVTEVLRIKNPKLSGYKISFSVTSDYLSIKKLIEAYEKSTRLFFIDSITIGRFVKKDEKGQSQDDPNDPTLTSNISFNVYYLKP